ncbi:cytochrome-c peroxidase [Sanyastnella coralliicola]|uniref:cytochrome-c peroxidase n=1 Tax=Sanyastnella coralliicola TaxID=3069118 RepID=UPI0027B96F3F|nr:cytochrome c peroxidase [Longitalea sp. SCSIO 12813]
MKGKVVLCIISFVIVFAGCKEDNVLSPPPSNEKTLSLPETPFDYEGITLPAYFTESGALDLFEAIPSDNPVTNHGATLGRVLFYDEILSVDGTISCGSCHHQEHAFADNDRFSEGLNGVITPRNSMAMFNLQYSRRFFWDRRTNGLENQVLEPIQHPEEMGLTLTEAVERVESQDYYPALFEAAFGDPTVTADRMSLALSQFIRSIVSYRSKWDEGYDIDFANFTELEAEGRELFFNGVTRCNQCHMTVQFYTPGTANTGLDENYADGGAGDVNGNPNDHGKFKMVSLRNLGYTAPYMHDGRFATLEEALEHYNSNIVAHPNLDDRLTYELTTGGTPIVMNLSESDIEALVAFLHTLDDPYMITEEMYANPFTE